MSKFGWSLPAGADSHPYAPWNLPDLMCELCGKDPAGGEHGCECPECTHCGIVGLPTTLDHQSQQYRGQLLCTECLEKDLD